MATSKIKQSYFFSVSGTTNDNDSEKLIDYPYSGLNRDNCFIVSAMVYRTNNQWVLENVNCWLASQGIVIQVTNNLLYDRPFKILIKGH